MRIFEPHAHMYCRLTDDYERMALCGITTIQEPAFWLGTERTHPESFYDYFEHITVFEKNRAAKYGIRHYQSIGVNPKDAENLEVTLPTVKGMRRFFERPSVIGVGEMRIHDVAGKRLTYLLQTPQHLVLRPFKVVSCSDEVFEPQPLHPSPLVV